MSEDDSWTALLASIKKKEEQKNADHKAKLEAWHFLPAASFSPNIPNKIGMGIDVFRKNTLIKTEDDHESAVAIADEPIDAKVDGKKMFCVRVDNAGSDSSMSVMLTPMETFPPSSRGTFGCCEDHPGCGFELYSGQLWFPVSYSTCCIIIAKEISKKAKEIIAILTISNNGKKKEIQFLCDGKQSKSTDVSEFLKGDRLFPAFWLRYKHQQITAIAIDQIQTRTPEIEDLIKEYQQQNNNKNNQSGGAVAFSSSGKIGKTVEHIASLDTDMLCALLTEKNASTFVVDLIRGEQYTGEMFVDKDFIAEGFTAELRAKYKLNNLHMRSIERIRRMLLGIPEEKN
jgi:hypothetical protein